MHLVFVDAYLFERAVHQFVDSVLGYVLERCLEVAVVFAEYRLYLPEDHLVLVFAQWCDGPLVDGESRVGYHLFHVHLADHSESFAVRAGTFG